MAGTDTKPNARAIISHGTEKCALLSAEKATELLSTMLGGYNLTPKIKWQRLPGLKLQAYTDDVAPRGFERGLNESDMDPVQAWSEQCHCGTRMSFNVWKFKNEKQITMFLIRWSE